MSNVHQAIWKSTQLDMREFLYAGGYGRPAKSVGRRIPYNDYEGHAIVREIAKSDIALGISPRQGLGLEG